MRTLTLPPYLFVLACFVPATGVGQSLFSYDVHPYTWLIDTRAEALGRANMALPGDLRALSTNPAGLVELQGFELYHRQASRYYFFETSSFTHVAVGCRLSERLAFGFRYDQDLASSEELDFSDPLGGPVEQPSPQGVFGVATAYRLLPGLSFGASIANLHTNNERIATPHLDVSLAKVVAGLRTDRVRSTFRAAAGLENVFSAAVDRQQDLGRGFVLYERYELPVIARIGVSASWAFHHGWIHDSLPTIACTVQAQFDDDLRTTLHTGLRAGLEVEALGMIALRLGWYTLTIDDQNWPQTQKSTLSDLTYGLGLRLPLGQMFGAKCPFSASFDLCSMPQPAFTLNELDPHTEEPWERFQSWGIRLVHGIGPLLKHAVPKVPSTP